MCCGLNSINVVSDQGEDPSFDPANYVGSKALVSSDCKAFFGCICVSCIQQIVRSGVDVVRHRLEWKVGWSSGLFIRFRSKKMYIN